MENKKVLITGASGFVGSYVTKALIDAGYNVSAICRSNSNFWRLEGVKNKIEWFNIDTLKSIDQIFESGSYSAVIHLAVEYGKNENYNEYNLVNTNILFPLNLFTVANQKGVKLFFNADTFYNLKYDNMTAYTLSKKHFIEWLEIFSKTHKIRIVNMKLFHVYGLLDSNDKFVPSIILSCMKKQIIPMTSGQQMRDFVYVEDVAGAFVAVLSKELENSSRGMITLDVGTGKMTTIREFVEQANSLWGGRAILDFGTLPDRQGEDDLDKPNLERITQYGWRSKIFLEDGLRLVIDWLKNYRRVNII